jgi:signal transduction histidine kinase
MIESGKLTVDAEYVSLEGIIRRRIDVVRYLASEKNIAIEVKIEKLPPVFADERLLSQVVDNLLSNALKFSPPGSTVRIRTAHEGSCGAFSVIDEGPGIPEAKRRLLFQSFSTIGSQTTGGERSTGLGLAIVKRIVEAHRGEIRIHNGARRGTEFKVLLPV